MTLEQVHERRCGGKRRLSPRKAGVIAGLMSVKHRELLIAYECFDCGYWHVGHADSSQIKAHGDLLERLRTHADTCQVCGQKLSLNRRVAIVEGSAKPGTCSTACIKALKHKRKAAAMEAQRQPDEGIVQTQPEPEPALEAV